MLRMVAWWGYRSVSSETIPALKGESFLANSQYHVRNAKTPAAKQMLESTLATMIPETMR